MDKSQRIALSGTMPMLVQRIAASSCAATSGVVGEASLTHLTEAKAEYELTLAALRDGNEDLGIFGQESNGKILETLNDLDARYQNIRPSLNTIVSGDGMHADFMTVDEAIYPLYDLTEALSADIAGEYFQPYLMSKADVFLIKLITRAQAQTQEIAKLACEIWSDVRVEEARAELAAVISIYEATLLALRDGNPTLGVRPAPTDEIAAELNYLLKEWYNVKATLVVLSEGGPVELQAKVDIYTAMGEECARMKSLTGLYSDVTEGDA